MATYSKGANGTFSGKVGRVIGSNWRSIDYLKAMAMTKKRSLFTNRFWRRVYKNQPF
ncbi:hypothetical protein [Pedobacter psychrodurus]|uniref:hypothetical protein n=1 Tax=Pedobacter psychrodurus TaxID=2530456 RepID=UPI00267C7AEE|nr:hypothetical protein [Pedobacter psychrodurus]